MKKCLRILLISSLLVNTVFISLWAYYFATGRHRRMIVPFMTTEYMVRRDLFRSLPRQEVRTVFIGDSITSRCELTELFGGRGVVNRGIAGDIVAGMFERADEVARLAPESIFIMAGINDLGIKKDPDDVLRDYRKLLERLRSQSPRSSIYIQSVLPIIPSRVKIDPAAIVRVNAGLMSLAQESGAHVAFIDLHEAFSDGDGNLREDLTYDGVHLNGAGYLRWKSCIESYLP
ncbi:MAG: G-D-S-L family lipolytic protein [Spirochaetes bacterium]|nr:G-D-S-L family lipolytic protein [Spirochaetota bacterium]